MMCSLACLGVQKMDKTNPSPGGIGLLGIDSTPWGCQKNSLQSWGSPDACGELPGFYAKEAGCEQEFIVSNCFTLASMSQTFPGSILKELNLHSL